MTEFHIGGGAAVLFLCILAWFVWKAGYGRGYEVAAERWGVEDDEDGIVKFQWPTCPECGHGITVHRCWKGQWQSSCDCGFAWCATPYEALLCTERPEPGGGQYKEGCEPPKVENDVPKGVIVKKDPVS